MPSSHVPGTADPRHTTIEDEEAVPHRPIQQDASQADDKHLRQFVRAIVASAIVATIKERERERERERESLCVSNESTRV